MGEARKKKRQWMQAYYPMPRFEAFMRMRASSAYPLSVVCMLIDPFSAVNSESMSNSEEDPLEPVERDRRLELSLYRYASPELL